MAARCITGARTAQVFRATTLADDRRLADGILDQLSASAHRQKSSARVNVRYRRSLMTARKAHARLAPAGIRRASACNRDSAESERVIFVRTIDAEQFFLPNDLKKILPLAFEFFRNVMKVLKVLLVLVPVGEVDGFK